MRLATLLGLGVLCVVIPAFSATGAEIHVPADQPTIQAAISAANTGDEVIVAPGTYFETINLLGKTIVVRGDLGATQTTIDGGGQPGSVVECVGGEGPNTVLQGFTITGGTGSQEGNTYWGLGMILVDSSPTILDCIFQDLTTPLSSDGGGIACRNSSPRIVGCDFNNNSASFGGAIINAEGGSPEVIDCTFDGNSAPFGDGGAILSISGKITIIDCIFRNNSALARGGAVKTSTTSVAASASCIIDCLFVGNSAANGGALYNHSGHTTITNTTIADNTATTTASAIHGESAHLFNCVIWGNGPVPPLASTIWDLDYCVIQGGYPGVGNLVVDPQFVNPGAGDYSLSSSSPAIDAGNNGADTDAIAPGVQPIPALDLAHLPRFADVPAVVDTGVGPAPVVDMGCYEVQGGVSFIRGDASGDGIVNAIAEALFLLAFGFQNGPEPPCLAAADVDGNGILNPLTEALYCLGFGFQGGPPPPAPFPDCGPESIPGTNLGCETPPCP